MQQPDQIGWLLNLVGDFDSADLKATNSKPIKKQHFRQLQLGDQILSGDIYTYSVHESKFVQKKMSLLPNIVLLLDGDGADHVILSNCLIQKKKVSYKESQVSGLILADTSGSTYMFFTLFSEYLTWYKQLKQFCKLQGFQQKYKLADKMHPGMYQCIKRKDKAPFTVQIYKTEDFLDCPELKEAVDNEIHILRSIKHQSLLDLKRVYGDPKYLFIVYENYKGESLFQLMNGGMNLHEVQVASIIYQCLQVSKFLNQHQFYHGNITPQTILINTNNQMLQITLINLSFKEYKVNDTLDWILNRSAEQFIAPEISQGVAPNIQGDLYAIGAVLYFMSFYDPTQYSLKNDDVDFYQVMETFDLNSNLIDDQELFLSKPLDYSSQSIQITQTSQNQISASQIDLMKKLLAHDPSQRYGLNEASKHHWFVNVKNKIKSMKVERKHKKPMASLRTIIELREQSEMDLRMTLILQQNNLSSSRFKDRKQTLQSGGSLNIDFSDIDEFQNDQHIYSLIEQINQQCLTNQPSKKNHKVDQIQSLQTQL